MKKIILGYLFLLLPYFGLIAYMDHLEIKTNFLLIGLILMFACVAYLTGLNIGMILGREMLRKIQAERKEK